MRLVIIKQKRKGVVSSGNEEKSCKEKNYQKKSCKEKSIEEEKR